MKGIGYYNGGYKAMLEILQYYTSGFWVWAGLTFGLAVLALPFTALAERIGK